MRADPNPMVLASTGTIFRQFTVERFAALRPAWLERISPYGVLLFRVHPNNNRAVGDEDVVARAVLWFPHDRYEELSDEQIGWNTLRRLTIRARDLVDRPSANDDIKAAMTQSKRQLFEAVSVLPLVELPTEASLQGAALSRKAALADARRLDARQQ